VLTVLVNFLANWNNFLTPLIYLTDWDKMTLPIGLRLLSGYQGTGSAAVIFAGLFISIVPPLLIYLFGQKHLVEGVALTGLKS
jgi:multiple sugar transport system permease protein